jgi:hypothetical protein
MQRCRKRIEKIPQAIRQVWQGARLPNNGVTLDNDALKRLIPSSTQSLRCAEETIGHSCLSRLCIAVLWAWCNKSRERNRKWTMTIHRTGYAQEIHVGAAAAVYFVRVKRYPQKKTKCNLTCLVNPYACFGEIKPGQFVVVCLRRRKH